MLKHLKESKTLGLGQLRLDNALKRLKTMKISLNYVEIDNNSKICKTCKKSHQLVDYFHPRREEGVCIHCHNAEVKEKRSAYLQSDRYKENERRYRKQRQKKKLEEKIKRLEEELK